MGYFWNQLLFEATLWDGIIKFGKAIRLRFIKSYGSNASYYFICDLLVDSLVTTKAPDLLLGIYLSSYLLNIKLISSTQDLWILRDPQVCRKTVHRNISKQLRNAVTAIGVQPVKSDISTLVNFWPWRKSFITKCGDYVLPAGLRLECSITVRTANARRFNWKRWPLFITGFLFCTKLHPSRSDISRHGNARQCLNTLPWVL